MEKLQSIRANQLKVNKNYYEKNKEKKQKRKKSYTELKQQCNF